MPAPFHNTAMVDARNAQQRRLRDLSEEQQLKDRVSKLERDVEELRELLSTKNEAPSLISQPNEAPAASNSRNKRKV